MKRKTPERTCMACGIKTEKSALARIVRTKDGNIFFDSNGKISGRGAYICKNIECLNKVIKSNKLSKSLNCSIEDTLYDKLREAFIDE